MWHRSCCSIFLCTFLFLVVSAEFLFLCVRSLVCCRCRRHTLSIFLSGGGVLSAYVRRVLLWARVNACCVRFDSVCSGVNVRFSINYFAFSSQIGLN